MDNYKFLIFCVIVGALCYFGNKWAEKARQKDIKEFRNEAFNKGRLYAKTRLMSDILGENDTVLEILRSQASLCDDDFAQGIRFELKKRGLL